MPFDDEVPKTPKVKLKNQNKPSIFDSMPKPVSKDANFKEAAAANSRSNDYKQKAVDLSIRYKKLLEDKTLDFNKAQSSSEEENLVIRDMVNLAIEINTDELELEGMGSIGVITLLLKMLLLQRDKINKLEYVCSTFDKEIKALKLTSNKDETK